MEPQFPSFKKLTLDDRAQYLRLVSEYTPFSDISFTTLHIWWNLDEKLHFSVLNENLVLNYSQPFDKAGAGLCLIGRHQVDDSILTIFEYLLEHGRTQKLVHVPEFVVDKISDKNSFSITEEPDMHEYIMDSAACAKLNGRDLGRIRRKVNRFGREVEGRRLELKTLELSEVSNQTMILNAIRQWHKKFPKANDPGRTEDQALQASLSGHRALELHNLCLFIDGQIQAVALYHLSHDRKYLILNHLKVDYTIPFVFDYLTNQVALKAVESGIPYLNMEMDLGLEGLRRHKQGLRPIRLFKKFSIEPASS